MANKTTVSRGENCGIKAAHGIKSLIHKIKAFDKRCVAKARGKNCPGWLGHIPLLSAILAVTVLLAYFSLYILFTFGLLMILFSVVANIDKGSLLGITNSTPKSADDEYRAYDNINSVDDGSPYGESFGTWSDND